MYNFNFTITYEINKLGKLRNTCIVIKISRLGLRDSAVVKI